MRGSVFIPAAMLLLSVTACNRVGTERSYAVVGDSVGAVRAAFNRDVGKVRVLMVLSPTCGACLDGAYQVSQQVAGINQGKTVPLYVLWVPRRGGREKDVPGATRVVADSSAHEFWDGNDLLGTITSKCSGGGAMRGTFTCCMDPRHSGTAICHRPRTSSCTRLRRKVRDWMLTSLEKE